MSRKKKSMASQGRAAIKVVRSSELELLGKKVLFPHKVWQSGLLLSQMHGG
jgi:hypothetical protein